MDYVEWFVKKNLPKWSSISGVLPIEHNLIIFLGTATSIRIQSIFHFFEDYSYIHTLPRNKAETARSDRVESIQITRLWPCCQRDRVRCALVVGHLCASESMIRVGTWVVFTTGTWTEHRRTYFSEVCPCPRCIWTSDWGKLVSFNKCEWWQGLNQQNLSASPCRMKAEPNFRET